MTMHSLRFTLPSLVLLWMVLASSDATDVFLDTKNGRLKGSRTEYFGDEYVDTYKGIPYALPPTGDRRFRVPVPATPWTGVRDATYFRSKCPQVSSNNEDCLSLNVYTWKSKSGTTPTLPVMVFIHGGAFKNGGSSLYGGSALALHSVVIVTINYRLGIMGFLSTGDDAAPGNFGMMDQVLALKWVRDNIASFGGDPNRVTIFGESAGAASVSLLLLSPLSRGLFHAAIMESGTAITAWAYRTSEDHPAPIDGALFIGQKVGCSETNTTLLVECLRKVNVSKLVSVQMDYTLAPGRIAWSPVVETSIGFLPANPLTLIERGDLMHVPTIRGVNKNEFTFFMTQIPGIANGMSLSSARKYIEDNINSVYSTNQKSVQRTIEDFYLKDVDGFDHVDIRTRVIQFISDFKFYVPAVRESELQSSTTGSPVYMYEFDYRSSKDTRPAWEGVPHTAELQYVFGAPLLGGPHWTQHDKALSSLVMGQFTSFAKNGIPSYNGVATWKPFTISGQGYLAIGVSDVIMKSKARTNETKLWLETVPKLVSQVDASIIG